MQRTNIISGPPRIARTTLLEPASFRGVQNQRLVEYALSVDGAFGDANLLRYFIGESP